MNSNGSACSRVIITDYRVPLSAEGSWWSPLSDGFRATSPQSFASLSHAEIYQLVWFFRSTSVWVILRRYYSRVNLIRRNICKAFLMYRKNWNCSYIMESTPSSNPYQGWREANKGDRCRTPLRLWILSGANSASMLFEGVLSCTVTVCPMCYCAFRCWEHEWCWGWSDV